MKNKKAKKLKLYVWEDVLTDWSSGVMFALASSPDEARKVILEKTDSPRIAADLQQEPVEIDKPEGFYVFGGE